MNKRRARVVCPACGKMCNRLSGGWTSKHTVYGNHDTICAGGEGVQPGHFRLPAGGFTMTRPEQQQWRKETVKYIRGGVEHIQLVIPAGENLLPHRLEMPEAIIDQIIAEHARVARLEAALRRIAGPISEDGKGRWHPFIVAGWDKARRIARAALEDRDDTP